MDPRILTSGELPGIQAGRILGGSYIDTSSHTGGPWIPY
jgi:hypothetical protein